MKKNSDIKLPKHAFQMVFAEVEQIFGPMALNAIVNAELDQEPDTYFKILPPNVAILMKMKWGTGVTADQVIWACALDMTPGKRAECLQSSSAPP